MLSSPCCNLFLPTDESVTGYLVGWNPHSFMCTVCAVVPSESTSLETLEATLSTFATTAPALGELIAHCGGPPSILGVMLPQNAELDLATRTRAEAAELWLTLETGDGKGSYPNLRAVHCCGCRHQAPLQLTLFRRGRHDGEWSPRPSLIPLWEDVGADVASPDTPAEIAAGSRHEGAAHTAASALSMTLRHVSCSGEWQRALHDALARASPTGRFGAGGVGARRVTLHAPVRAQPPFVHTLPCLLLHGLPRALTSWPRSPASTT